MAITALAAVLYYLLPALDGSETGTTGRNDGDEMGTRTGEARRATGETGVNEGFGGRDATPPRNGS